MTFKEFLSEADNGSYGVEGVTRMQLNKEANDMLKAGKDVPMIVKDLEKKYKLKKVEIKTDTVSKDMKKIMVVNVKD